MAIDRSGTYFRKTVGVVGRNTAQDEETAVACMARHAQGPDDLRNLLEHVGLVDVARQMAAKRSA